MADLLTKEEALEAAKEWGQPVSIWINEEGEEVILVGNPSLSSRPTWTRTDVVYPSGVRTR